MSGNTRTIDNLGPDPSVRYAQDRQTLDPRLVQDSLSIPSKAEVSVIKPYVPSEFEALFSVTTRALWALFPPPATFFLKRRPFFTHRLIPSLGNYESQEETLQKVQGLSQQDEDEDENQDAQRKQLLAFLKRLEGLERTLQLINARRNQYQRG